MGSYCTFRAWQSTFRRGFHKDSGSAEVVADAAAAAAAEAVDDDDDGPVVVTRACDVAFLLARKNQTRLAEAELSSMNSQRGMGFEGERRDQTRRWNRRAGNEEQSY